jgi:methylthioribose-1-phosphate isomerase
MSYQEKSAVHALQWTGEALQVLDQRQLPKKVAYDHYTDAPGVAEAIKSMRVRGAPAIGIAAAYGVVLSVRQQRLNCPHHWQKKVRDDLQILAESRPTAVNLFWALDMMQQQLDKNLAEPLPELLSLAQQIHAQDIAANHKMGELGAEILGRVQGVLTHCNAGALATGGYGTALGVIRSAWDKGLRNIYATETRPWQQGARLTAWELQEDGIATTLIADSAAAYLMQTGKIDWVIVGADRIAVNGDVANKIGTYSLAILARQHQVKMMVVAPTSTIDWKIQNGSQIEIEQRAPAELLPDTYLQKDALVQAWNPVFDVTPAELISVCVTECGVVENPGNHGLMRLKK